MKRDFANMVALQHIDLRIIELQHSKQEFPLSVAQKEKEIADARALVASLEEKIAATISDKAKSEEQVADAQRFLDRSQDRLNAIKTNKEFDAVHAEIEAQKHLIASSEKRSTKVTAKIENLHTVINDQKNKLDQLIAQNQPLIDDLKEKVASIDSKVAVEVAERNTVLPSIPKPYLRSYEHILANRKNGKVLSVLTPLDKGCQNCFQTLPPQIINQMKRADRIYYCQSCGSILVWDDGKRE